MTSTSEVWAVAPYMPPTCERCEGSGILLFEVASHLNYVRQDSVRCPSCHGKGRLTEDA